MSTPTRIAFCREPEALVPTNVLAAAHLIPSDGIEVEPVVSPPFPDSNQIDRLQRVAAILVRGAARIGTSRLKEHQP